MIIITAIHTDICLVEITLQIIQIEVSQIGIMATTQTEETLIEKETLMEVQTEQSQIIIQI